MDFVLLCEPLSVRSCLFVCLSDVFPSNQALELHQVFCQKVEQLQEDDGGLRDHEVGQRGADLKPEKKLKASHISVKLCLTGLEHLSS